jgi:predicted nucleic acid-binding protein
LAAYFFDTSALLKRYHRELSTERVDQIFAERDSSVFISRLTVVEMTSAFAIKARIGLINWKEASLQVQRFKEDAETTTIDIVAVTEFDFSGAEWLINKICL